MQEYMMADWDDFRIVLAIQREKTLSGAARRLRVDQSTVGRRLTSLEAKIGARLFDRTPEGYLLTAAGEAVLPQLLALEDAAIAIERKLAAEDAELAGPVRVATSDSFAAWFLVPLLHELRREQPEIVVELVTGNPPVRLARREADVSIRLNKPKEPNLIAKRLGRAGWAVYVAKRYVQQHGVPDARRGFEGHALVALADELRGTVGASWMAENAGRARVALCSNSLLSQAEAVVSGLGFSALPCVFGDREARLLRIAPGVIGHHDIWRVVHPDVQRSARVRAVLAFLTRVIAAHAELLTGARSSRPRRAAPRASAAPPGR